MLVIPSGFYTVEVDQNMPLLMVSPDHPEVWRRGQEILTGSCCTYVPSPKLGADPRGVKASILRVFCPKTMDPWAKS